MTKGAVTIVVETHIDASAEQVWPWLVDWENLGRWMLEGSNFQVLGDKRDGVGVRARAKIKIAGISTTDVVTVTGWDPPTKLVVSHEGWVSGVGVLECSRTGAGTVLRWTEVFEPPLGIVGRLGLQIFKPLMRRVFARDLRILKQLVESQGAGFNS